MTLDEIGIKYNTDKSSIAHNFLNDYEKLIGKKKIKSIKTVLEIGVQTGGSLRMWRDFFPNAIIYGFDIDEKVLFSEDRIQCFKCDQSSASQIINIMKENNIQPDLVIDDGSHLWSHQLLTFNTIFPLLKKGSIYICEDLHTSFMDEYKDSDTNPYEFFSKVDNCIMIEKGGLPSRTCVIKKNTDSPKEVNILKSQNNLTLATCSYNTPNVTMNMIKSFRKYNKFSYDLLITDNSTNEETAELLKADRTSYLRNPGFHHSIGVDVLLDNCTTKYMLLVDTDVIFLKNIESIFHKFIKSGAAICGVLQGSRGAYNLYDRICPWFCFIDVEVIKRNNIKFFDNIRFSQHLSAVKATKIYDVGATFLEDINNLNLGVLYISEQEQNEYIQHFEGMSWRIDCDIPEISELGKGTLKSYDEYIKNYNFEE
jgi:hypothetical protein